MSEKEKYKGGYQNFMLMRKVDSLTEKVEELQDRLD